MGASVHFIHRYVPVVSMQMWQNLYSTNASKINVVPKGNLKRLKVFTIPFSIIKHFLLIQHKAYEGIMEKMYNRNIEISLPSLTNISMYIM